MNNIYKYSIITIALSTTLFASDRISLHACTRKFNTHEEQTLFCNQIQEDFVTLKEQVTTTQTAIQQEIDQIDERLSRYCANQVLTKYITLLQNVEKKNF